MQPPLPNLNGWRNAIRLVSHVEPVLCSFSFKTPRVEGCKKDDPKLRQEEQFSIAIHMWQILFPKDDQKDNTHPTCSSLQRDLDTPPLEKRIYVPFTRSWVGLWLCKKWHCVTSKIRFRKWLSPRPSWDTHFWNLATQMRRHKPVPAEIPHGVVSCDFSSSQPWCGRSHV